jgi:hypothetical protein
MSTDKKEKIQAITQAIAAQPESAGFSLKGVLDKLPNWALVPGTIILFGLLLTDTVIADPIPFVDEAALLYAFMSGLRVLGTRRKQKRELAQLEAGILEDTDIVIDVEEFEPRSRITAPGQPLAIPAA